MSTYEFVEYSANPDSHIARVTLNRPERLNALNDQMQLEVTDASQDHVEGVTAFRQKRAAEYRDQ